MDESSESRGLFLHYSDFQRLEQIILKTPIAELPEEDRKLLWKVKTIILNIQTSRIRRGQEI
jgi:hypothetical protein